MPETTTLTWAVLCTDVQSRYTDGKTHHVVVLRGKAPTCSISVQSEHELPFSVGEEYFLELAPLHEEDTL